MTATALVEVLPAAPSLDTLQVVIAREHGLATEAASLALEHALRAGEALNAARIQIPHGEWLPWLEANFPGSAGTAYTYMRLAHYRDELVASEVVGIKEALRKIDRLPRGYYRDAEGERLRSEALALHNRGSTPYAISIALNVPKQTVTKWVDPEAFKNAEQVRAERQKQRDAARRALEREERAKVARKVGGSIGEAYAMSRRFAELLDQAEKAAGSPEARKALATALRRLYAVEDEIGKAVRLS